MSSAQGKARYQPGDKIGGRYQVHKALMGGMGEVYLCLDLQEMEPYALKTFQQRYLTDTRLLRRAFEQEVATWVALEKHPNIVRCFYMDTLDRQPYMVLEWIVGEEGRGTDLRGWLRRGPLELKLALEIALDICNGLRHAQAMQPGLVHRDLKPENILVAQGGLAKITDFGLAQIVEEAGLEVDADFRSDSRQSIVGRLGIAGTPPYMAPEQWHPERWRVEPLDVRTDIYALGCILYEMVAGMQPFPVDFTPSTPQAWQVWLQSMQAAHETAPLPHLPAGLPAAFEEVLQRCLAKAQADRFATLDDLSGQLVNLYQQCFDQPPPVRPPAGTFTATDYINRGITHTIMQQYEQAFADLNRATLLAPNLAKAFSGRGFTHHALKQYKQALEDYNRAIELDANDSQTYVNRGATYVTLQQYEQALTDFDRAIVLDANDAKAFYNRGHTNASLEQYDRSLEDFSCVLKLEPSNVEAYYRRGDIYASLQRYDRALEDYNRAIELDPNNATAYYNCGIAHFAMRQYSRALADFDQAIALDPHHARAYYRRGSTYGALKQYVRALADFDSTISLDPNHNQAYIDRGEIYDALKLYEQALADFDRAIELDPNDAKAYDKRGYMCAALKQYDRALANYDRAIELDSNMTEAYTDRGETYDALKQYEQALADFDRAIALDPNHARAYVSRGVLLGNQGRLAEALASFEQAARLGDPIGVQYAAITRQRLRMEPTPPANPAQQAFDAFRQAASPEAMRQAAIRFPLLLQVQFIATIEQVIAQQIPPAQRPPLQQRLAWLRQVAGERKE